jgi:uncharacterized protein (DUF952 family)
VTRIYKVVGQAEWADAEREGAFRGAEIDLRDGYIHLSDGEQVERTVALYFAERDDLVLVALEAEPLGAALKWEPSRGGAQFPHLYGPLDPARVTGVRPLALNAEGWPDPGPLAP